MSEQILLRTQVAVANGPKLEVSRKLEVAAFDKLSVPLAGDGKEVEVSVQPNTTGVKLLVMMASRYGDNTYRVKGTGNPTVVLDQPQVLFGAGLLGLLGSAPTTLVLKNTSTTELTVQILVGRDIAP